MKSKWTLVLIVLMAIVLHAYKAFQSAGISGKVSPQNAAELILAIEGADSIKVIPANGVFMLEAKPGMYKVIVDAKEPFKDVLIKSIEVTSGKTTDLGEIKVSQ